MGCVGGVGEEERNREKDWILEWNEKDSFALARSGKTMNIKLDLNRVKE
jgi:hypothetical protein